MKKRNLLIAGVVLLLLIPAVLLPVFLSSGVIQDRVVRRLNDHLPGTLSLGGCSIGWQQDLQCSDLAYDDPRHGVHVTVPKLAGNRGLLALLVAPMNLGTITVDDPVAVLPASTSGKNDHLPGISGSTEGQSPDTLPRQQPQESDGSAPIWDKMIVKLQVNRAAVKLALSPDSVEPFIRNGMLDARLASGTVHFDLGMESGDGGGLATANGFVNLPARKGALLETLVSEVNLHVMDMQIEHFLALIPGQVFSPRGKGDLSSDLLIKAAGVDNIQISGINTLRHVQMSGGFFGQDKPEFQQLQLDLDLKRERGRVWQLPRMQLTSDFGEIELAGSYSSLHSSFKGKGQLVLPVLLSQLPGLCRVRPGTELEDGTVNFTVYLDKDQHRLDVVTGALLGNLSGIRQGEAFAWSSPVSLNLAGSITDNEPQVREFAIRSPFLNLEGQGNLKAFNLQGTADLEKAMQEIGGVFQLAWNGSGSVHLAAESRSEADNNRYVIDGRMEIADFSLSRQQKIVVPSHQFSATGRLHTSGRFPENAAEAMDLDFDLSAWQARAHGRMGSIYRREGLLSARYQLQAKLMLGRLSDLLHSVGLLNRETTITGDMDLEASGYTEGNRLVVRELDGTIRDLILYLQGKVYTDSVIHLFTTSPAATPDVSGAVRTLALAESASSYFAGGGGNNLIDGDSRRIVLRDLGLSSDLTTLHVHRVKIEDWLQIPASLSMKVEGNGDLENLASVLQQYDLLDPEYTLGGTGFFSVELGKAAQGPRGTASLDVKHAVVGRGDQIVVPDEDLLFKTAFQGGLSEGDIDFEVLSLQSALLGLQARGRLQRTGPEPHFSVNGELEPDFSLLANLLSNLFGTDIQGKGGQKESLTLRYPLGGQGVEKYRKLQFATELDLDALSYAGVNLQQVTMPVHMENGLLKAALQGKLNSGAMQVTPGIDYTKEEPLVSLPDKEQLLTDVRLEKPLVDGVLKRISPLFGLLAIPTGTISARMDHFAWPLAAGKQAQALFSMVLNTSKMEVKANGVLHEVLEMAGLGDESLSLDQAEITCRGEQERISCSPLKMLVADSEMTLAGSMGFDGSIEYTLAVPVTEKLVGREGYKYVQGTTLKVPIRGNYDQVSIGADGLSRAISGLLTGAANKAAGRAVEEQVEKVVPGLLDNIMGR